MTFHRPQNKEPLFLIAGLTLAMVLIHNTGTDFWLAGHFFSGGQWIFRDNFFLEKILHKGGVIFTQVCLATLIFFRIKDRQDLFKKHYLNVVLISTILSIISVFLLKRVTTFPCPWSSQAFSGEHPLLPYRMLFATDYPKGRCFPAGHSSGGYAFLSLYFAYTFIYGKRNFRALIPGLFLGLVFGITQQLRGAHFLSHDLATIIVCIFVSWFTIWGYYSYSNKHET